MQSQSIDTTTERLPTIEVIEPFDRGAFVHFTHKLCWGLSSCGAKVSLVASRGFELQSLQRNYELVPSFDIPREDLYARAPKRALAKILWRAGVMRTRMIALAVFLCQFRRVMQDVVRRAPDFVFVGTVFRYPGMRYFLSRIRRSGVRVVQICHEFQMREERPTLMHRLIFKLNSKVYDSLDAVFFLSQAQRNLFQQSYPRVPSNRLFLIPMGNGEVFHEIADASTADPLVRSLGMNENTRSILFFGRIRSDKGVEDLLHAFAIVAKSRPEIRLVLVGHARTEFAKLLLRTTHELGIDDRVTLHPNYLASEFVWPLVSAARIVVYPYRSSSQSASLQVALSAGKPVIVTNVGGLPEVIQNGTNGLVVPPNSPGALASAIEILLGDTEYANRIAAHARFSAQSTHSWTNVAKSTLEALSNYDSDERWFSTHRKRGHI